MSIAFALWLASLSPIRRYITNMMALPAQPEAGGPAAAAGGAEGVPGVPAVEGGGMEGAAAAGRGAAVEGAARVAAPARGRCAGTFGVSHVSSLVCSRFAGVHPCVEGIGSPHMRHDLLRIWEEADKEG